MPVTRAEAEYMGTRYRILFGNSDSLALGAEVDAEMPDAFARGERALAPAGSEPWAKVPVSVIDGVIDVRVWGTVRGENVSLERQLSDGRVQVGFVGAPAAAQKLGLDGDQHMGWTGLFEPEEFSNIRTEESRRA